jgi:uncharacterized membrane protein YkvA (DUF1232 family)
MSDENASNHWLQKPPDDSVLQEIVRQIKLFWRLLKDRRVPLWIKAVPFISLIYLAVPTDLLPDVLLGLGQLDDLAVLALGYRLFIGMAPPEVVREHLNDLIASAARWKISGGEVGMGEEPVPPPADWKVIDGEAEPVDESGS